jgi:membrane protein YdbS with pleckstrin-like domain
MTNSPEASTPASEPTATDGTVTDGTATDGTATEPSVAEGAETSALDEGTFSRILEPRSANRIPIGDGTWHQLARQYVWVQLISSGILFLLVLAAALAIWLIVGVGWVWIPAGIVLVILAITLAVTPRQARAYGYQLREDDLVFRKGILWQRVVAVPYGRMQLVDITHGPLDRGFGIAQLKLVTAAATTGVAIPGIRQDAAEQLRDTLIAVAETRRTGL